MVPQLINSKLEGVEYFVLRLLVLGNKAHTLIKHKPNIKPSLGLVAGVHGNIVNFIVHLIAIALVAVTQINFQVFDKESSVCSCDYDLELSVIRMLLAVTDKRVDHLVATSKSTVNIVSC